MKDKQPSRLRCWVKRGAFTLAVLITLLAAVVVFENWRGHRAWQTYRAEQEAKGEVFDWRKLLPADIPDDENFATTPLLARLINSTNYVHDPSTGQTKFADPETSAHLESLFPWKRVPLGLGNWRKAILTDWKGVQDSLRALTNNPLPSIQALLNRPVGKPADDLLFLLEQSKSEMDELSAAAQRPHSDFLVHHNGAGITLLPQLAVIKDFAYAFQLRALAKLESGKTDEALADWQTCTRLGDALRGNPLLISLLVRLAIYEVSSKVIWEGLVKHKWSDAQLQVIEARFDEFNLVDEALFALRGERAFNLVAIDQMLRPEAAGFPRTIADEFPQLKWMPSGWVSQTKLSVARMYERYIFGAFDPDHRHVDIPLIHQYEREVESALSKTGPYTMMARMLFPAIGKSGLKVANLQMAINLARVAVALERHRLAHGSHPEALNALVPAYLEAVPLDLDRQPLRYQLQPDGSFILYSIGVDLKDDNGRIGKPDGRFTTEEGDWVWKYPEAADR